MSAQPADVLPTCSIPEAMYRVAHWWRVSRGLQANLGFARRSTVGRVMDEGAQGASHERGSPPPTWMAPADQEIDRIMARMPPELRDAVVLDQQRELRMRELCAQIHATPAEVHRRINAAYGFVAGMLTATSLRTPRSA